MVPSHGQHYEHFELLAWWLASDLSACARFNLQCAISGLHLVELAELVELAPVGRSDMSAFVPAQSVATAKIIKWPNCTYTRLRTHSWPTGYARTTTTTTTTTDTCRAHLARARQKRESFA